MKHPEETHLHTPQDSAGRVPFYLDDKGKIQFCLVAENNRIVDKKSVRARCGYAAASKLNDDTILLGLPRGTIKEGETPIMAAARESDEELHYNAYVTPRRNVTIHGQQVAAENYLEHHFPIQGKRGLYELTLFVDQVDPNSFTPKEMETKTERKIKERLGNTYQEGAKWATVSEMERSLEPLRKLVKHPNVMATEVGDLIKAHLKSMQNQIDAMRKIEGYLAATLRLEGKKVAKIRLGGLTL